MRRRGAGVLPPGWSHCDAGAPGCCRRGGVIATPGHRGAAAGDGGIAPAGAPPGVEGSRQPGRGRGESPKVRITVNCRVCGPFWAPLRRLGWRDRANSRLKHLTRRDPVRGPERAQPLSFSQVALFKEYVCAHARRAPRPLGREALRGGSAGSILDDFRHAFRPTAEAASRNFNGEPGIKRTSLDLSNAPCLE